MVDLADAASGISDFCFCVQARDGLLRRPKLFLADVVRQCYVFGLEISIEQNNLQCEARQQANGPISNVVDGVGDDRVCVVADPMGSRFGAVADQDLIENGDRTVTDFRAAVDGVQPEEEQMWHFDGPRVAADVHEQVRDGAGGLASRRSEWIRLNGVRKGMAEANEHAPSDGPPHWPSATV